MKLYVKEKFFSLPRKFTVYDQAGGDKYRVEEQFFTLGHKIHLYDLSGRERAYIHSRPFSWRPRFTVEVGGSQVCEIVKEFTFFKPSYRIEGKNWTAEGNFSGHDYVINGPRGRVASIHREWFTLGDAYEIGIADGEDEITVLAVLLTIDSVAADAASAAASSAAASGG